MSVLVSDDDDDYETAADGSEGNLLSNKKGIYQGTPESDQEELESLMKLANLTPKQQQTYEDEWEDDDDNGYVVITISTEDFFEMEEV